MTHLYEICYKENTMTKPKETKIKAKQHTITILIRRRDRKICREALSHKWNLKEIGKRNDNLSRQRIKQILKANNIKVPLTKGTRKYKNWIKRQRISQRKAKRNK